MEKKNTHAATGIRNPNGMSVSPQGVVTAAPQEGNWTPAGGVFEVTSGEHYGYKGPKITPNRPLGYDPPLAWIPRQLDNSTGSQVWVDSDRWGPLKGTLLNLSYGHCKMILMPLEKKGESLNSTWPLIPSQVDLPQIPLPKSRRYLQAASVSIPDLNFESGIMRGCFSPHDGQLYLSGLRGWTTSAVRDGCFQRVRYTGKPVHLPVKIATLKNGIAITFSMPIDKESAEDPDSYFVEHWNYWYSKAYGSPEYKVSSPREEGRDPVKVLSATLIDPKTVFIELEQVRPVMQMGINYYIHAADGTRMKNVCFHTINRIRDFEMDPKKLVRRKGKGFLDEKIVNQLKQGVHWEFINKKENKTFVSHSRLPHLLESKDKSNPSKPILAKAKFYLASPLKSEALFGIAGHAERLKVTLNDKMEFQITGQNDSLSETTPKLISLNKGFNRVEIEYLKPLNKNANFKLLWGLDASRMESIDPARISYLPSQETNDYHLRIRGKELFARHQCIRCHLPGQSASHSYEQMPEFSIQPPTLNDVANRLNKEWIAEWLVEPERVTNFFEMPSLLAKKERQQAVDLAAYLFSLKNPNPPKSFPFDKSSKDDLINQGEKLFENLGCISCHRLTEPNEEDQFSRRSLHFIKAKFTKSGLARFLKTPTAHQKWSRMPTFRLSDKEISGLVEFLREESEGSLSNWTSQQKGNPQRGGKLFLNRGCVSCHQVEASHAMNAKMTTIKTRQQGCLNPVTAQKTTMQLPNIPRYHLSEKDRTALQFFLKTSSDQVHQHNNDAGQRAEHFIKRLQCASCHDRDDQKSKRALVMITQGSGRAPAPIPNLTWSGEKLKADWTQRLLSGGIKKPMRNWLPARMPAFPAYAKHIAPGLAHQHGIPTGETANTPKPKFDPGLLEKGDLVASKKGLDCRQCHGVGSLQPSGDKNTKIAIGINFEIVADRLRYDFYRRFTLDPTRYDHSSKMPRLAPDGKTTKATNIDNGNARKQFDAAWQYIHHSKVAPVQARTILQRLEHGLKTSSSREGERSTIHNRETKAMQKVEVQSESTHLLANDLIVLPYKIAIERIEQMVQPKQKCPVIVGERIPLRT